MNNKPIVVVDEFSKEIVVGAVESGNIIEINKMTKESLFDVLSSENKKYIVVMGDKDEVIMQPEIAYYMRASTNLVVPERFENIYNGELLYGNLLGVEYVYFRGKSSLEESEKKYIKKFAEDRNIPFVISSFFPADGFMQFLKRTLGRKRGDKTIMIPGLEIKVSDLNSGKEMVEYILRNEMEKIIVSSFVDFISNLIGNEGKIIIEVGHVYSSEAGLSPFEEKIQILLKKGILERIGIYEDAEVVGLVDNYTPCFTGDKCSEEEILKFADMYKRLGVGKIFLEGDEEIQDIASQVLATFMNNGAIVEENGKIFLIGETEKKKIKKVLLFDNNQQKFSCALLDAAFSIIKFYKLNGQEIINILPLNNSNLSEDASYIEQQSNMAFILKEFFKYNGSALGIGGGLKIISIFYKMELNFPILRYKIYQI